MAMKKAFEIHISGDAVKLQGDAKVRITATARFGESRIAFNARAKRAASVVHTALCAEFGPLNVDWTHK